MATNSQSQHIQNYKSQSVRYNEEKTRNPKQTHMYREGNKIARIDRLSAFRPPANNLYLASRKTRQIMTTKRTGRQPPATLALESLRKQRSGNTITNSVR